jgi:site-specific DNA-methyltransferase (adenine-specific)
MIDFNNLPAQDKLYYLDKESGIAIYCADCRDILPLIPDKSIDLVLTDPPYGVGYVTSRRLHTHPLAVPIVGDEDLSSILDVLPELDRVLKDDRHVYLFSAPQRTGDIVKSLPQSWQLKNILIWDKGDAGTVGDLECGYGWNYEPIIYAMKGKRVLNPPRPRCILRFPWSGTRDPVHPTVKSVACLKQIILNSSMTGELVIDSFAGSGTTLMASKILGRKCIGIEIEEKYCEIAKKRLAQSVMKLEV